MRVAQVNMTDRGSTGKIMLNIAALAREKGIEAKTFSTITFKENKSSRENIPSHTCFGYYTENVLHTVLGKLTGYNGMFSYFGTKKLIRELKSLQPDIIHLHNLHQFCINLPLLFRYIKKNNIRVIWTLHDCWSFTGHCPYFDIEKCKKWKTGCEKCPRYQKYPQTYVDKSKSLYKKKQKWFKGIEDMTLVTPSKWLAGLVSQSYLRDYPCKVINNGIDLSIYKPTESDFREKNNLRNKKIILGVSFAWGYPKGLDVFIELSRRLGEDYQIVLVGTNEFIDAELPDNIISIHRTKDQRQLAEIYSAADLVLNPTREDNYPTVNMEAIACGTPVLTFNTGGSPEMLSDNSGYVLKTESVDIAAKEIERICREKPYTEEACLKQAKNFDMNSKFEEYISLYENSTHST